MKAKSGMSQKDKARSSDEIFEKIRRQEFFAFFYRNYKDAHQANLPQTTMKLTRS